mgnify:CR=1 FL=1
MRYARWLAVFFAVVGLGCQRSTLTAAKLYIKQQQPQKAKEQLAEALKLEPENAEAHFLMGKLLAAEGHYTEMVEHLDRAAGLSPKFQTEAEQTRRHYWAREYNAGVSYAQGERPDFGKALRSFHNATLIEERRNRVNTLYEDLKDNRGAANLALYSLGGVYTVNLLDIVLSSSWSNRYGYSNELEETRLGLKVSDGQITFELRAGF